MEQARLDAIARLSSHGHNSASKAQQYNKVSNINKNTKPPPPPSPSNDDTKDEKEDDLSPSERGRPSDSKFPPPPPKKSSVNSVASPVSPEPISPPVSRPKAPKSRPKIPKQPTIIITKKRSGAKPPPPPSTAASSMEDEKTGLPPPAPVAAVPPKFKPPPKGDASNIIICRVNLECKSQKGKQDIYEALRAFVKLQIDKPYPGTITYHFTCPNPVKYPLKLEFIELYYNEEWFWEHSKSQTFAKHYFKAFAGDKHTKSKAFVTLGYNLSSKVKQTTKGIGSTFPKSDAGYLLHEECFKALDYADDTKLMFKFHMIAPKYSQGNTKNVELIFDIMERMSVYAKQSYAVMFSAHRLNDKTYPDHLELISIWPNIQCLIEFLQNEKVQTIIYEFKELMISQTDTMNRKNHFLCELYSDIEINEEVMGMIKMVFDDIGYTQQIKTDVGYILHPKANSSQLK